MEISAILTYSSLVDVVVGGTILYSSPEKLRSDQVTDNMARADFLLMDVWSIRVVLAESICGLQIFDPSDPIATKCFRQGHKEGQPWSLDDCLASHFAAEPVARGLWEAAPEELQWAISQCLTHDYRQRMRLSELLGNEEAQSLRETFLMSTSAAVRESEYAGSATSPQPPAARFQSAAQDVVFADISVESWVSGEATITAAPPQPTPPRAQSIAASELESVSAAPDCEARLNAAEMKKSGQTAAQLKSLGYSATELRAAGFASAELYDAGYPVPQMMTAGYSLPMLKRAGYKVEEMRGHGHGVAELLEGGYTEAEIFGAGYSVADLRTAGLASVSSFYSARYFLQNN